MPQRSYERMCGLARALELVGDRWTLLLIRQLLTGPKRYVDLLGALHGLSTNLLSERLKRLEEDGLVVKRVLPPPAASSVYELSDFGAGVEPAILELMRWGSVLLADPARDSEPADPDWPLFPLRWLVARHPSDSDRSITIRIADAPPLTVEVSGSSAHIADSGRAPADASDALIVDARSGGALGAVLGGHIPLSAALRSGQIRLEGDATWFRVALREAYGSGTPQATGGSM